MHTKEKSATLTPFGLMAEFDNPGDLVAAAKQAHAAGYRLMDAYSPVPVHGLPKALGFQGKADRVPFICLVGGLCGMTLGLGLTTWWSVWGYPLNIGGRPLFSWPSFTPIIFECTILFSAFSAGIGMMALNGLPRFHHPVFDVPAFDRATSDRFFLCIMSTDSKFQENDTQSFLEGLHPISVTTVPVK